MSGNRRSLSGTCPEKPREPEAGQTALDAPGRRRSSHRRGHPPERGGFRPFSGDRKQASGHVRQTSGSRYLRSRHRVPLPAVPGTYSTKSSALSSRTRRRTCRCVRPTAPAISDVTASGAARRKSRIFCCTGTGFYIYTSTWRQYANDVDVEAGTVLPAVAARVLPQRIGSPWPSANTAPRKRGPNPGCGPVFSGPCLLTSKPPQFNEGGRERLHRSSWEPASVGSSSRWVTVRAQNWVILRERRGSSPRTSPASDIAAESSSCDDRPRLRLRSGRCAASATLGTIGLGSAPKHLAQYRQPAGRP